MEEKISLKNVVTKHFAYFCTFQHSFAYVSNVTGHFCEILLSLLSLLWSHILNPFKNDQMWPKSTIMYLGKKWSPREEKWDWTISVCASSPQKDNHFHYNVKMLFVLVFCSALFTIFTGHKNKPKMNSKSKKEQTNIKTENKRRKKLK